MYHANDNKRYLIQLEDGRYISRTVRVAKDKSYYVLFDRQRIQVAWYRLGWHEFNPNKKRWFET